MGKMKKTITTILLILLLTSTLFAASSSYNMLSSHYEYGQASWNWGDRPTYKTTDVMHFVGFDYAHYGFNQHGCGWNLRTSANIPFAGTHKVKNTTANEMAELSDLVTHKIPFGFEIATGFSYNLNLSDHNAITISVLELLGIDLWNNATPDMTVDFGTQFELLHTINIDTRSKFACGIRANIIYGQYFFGWMDPDNSNHWQESYFRYGVSPFMGFIISK